jgi:hypothetical protein
MISWVAMNRMVERKMATDEGFREKVAGRLLHSKAKRIADGELFARLRFFGIDLDRSLLERLCNETLSAEEIGFTACTLTKMV